MTTTTRNEAALCTYKWDGRVCGKPQDDETVHVWGEQRMRRGAHVWRHEPSSLNAAGERLLSFLRDNAADDINRTQNDGAAADAYRNALYQAETELPKAHSWSFREGARLGAKGERRATVERIELALEAYKLGFDTAARTDYYRMEDVYAVLRAEAAR